MNWGLRLVVAVTTALSALAGPALAVRPGMRAAVTQKGLDYVVEVGIPLLKTYIASTQIEDVNGSTSVADYYLTGIQLSDIEIPHSSLTSGSNGVQLQSSNISMSLHADWSYRTNSWPHISDQGTGDISISESSLAISVIAEKDSHGHPTVNTTGCSVDIGPFKINLHGGASVLYNVVADLLTDKLKRGISDQLCEAAKNEINGSLDQRLESEPVVHKLKLTEIDYSLLDIIFTPAYVESQHKGEFLLVSDPEEAPFLPSPLPSIASTGISNSKMLYVWLTDYIVNTASYVYWKAGIFKYTITADQVAFLDTSYFEYLVPGLYSKYPNMKMKLELSATAPPNLTVVPGNAELRMPGNIVVYVLHPNKTTEVAFVIGAMVHANVSVFVHNDGTDQIITANATLSKTELNLTSSNVGTFSISDLECSVNVLSQLLVMPFINHYGNKGLPIPMFDGLSLVNSTIAYHQGYVAVCTDVEYNGIVYDKQ